MVAERKRSTEEKGQGDHLVEINEIEKSERKSKLLVKGTDSAFINSIRRAAMKDVPTIAIDEITFYDNNSVLFDEFLAHRIGMLPIKTDLKTYKKGDKITFVVDKEGPGTVYSRDLQCTDPTIEIVDKNIPLTVLGENQRLKAEMTAVLDTTDKHIKHQPAIIGFQNLPEIISPKDASALKDVVACCPKNVLEIKAKKLVLKDPLECTLCGKCEEVGKKKGVLVSIDKNSFIFNIESNGNLENKEILIVAAKGLQKKFNELSSSLKSL